LKKRSIFTFGMCFVLFASLLFSNIILAQDGGSYDPWIDTDDDGIIDAIDLQALAAIYSTSGTPINKTELLLELEARIDNLNLTLLTEYYNTTECDSSFAPSAHTHNAEDITGGSLVVGSLLAWDEITGGYLEISGDAGISRNLIVDSGTLYVDAFSDKVGIGTTSPIEKLDVDGNTTIRGTLNVTNLDVAGDTTIGGTLNATKLDVSGDIKGETLKAEGIQLGDTEGDSYIYFYEDGSPTGECIRWHNVDDEFIVSDDIDIQGAITMNETTRYYSIPACAWLPASSDTNFVRTALSVYGSSVAQFDYWYAPVNLPHGAVVTEFRARVYDDYNQTAWSDQMYVQLWRLYGGGGSNLASVMTPLGFKSPDYVELTDSSINYATIDNQNYVYYVYGRTTVYDSHRLSHVWITYTITEPLP